MGASGSTRGQRLELGVERPAIGEGAFEPAQDQRQFQRRADLVGQRGADVIGERLARRVEVGCAARVSVLSTPLSRVREACDDRSASVCRFCAMVLASVPGAPAAIGIDLGLQRLDLGLERRQVDRRGRGAGSRPLTSAMALLSASRPLSSCWIVASRLGLRLGGRGLEARRGPTAAHRAGAAWAAICGVEVGRQCLRAARQRQAGGDDIGQDGAEHGAAGGGAPQQRPVGVVASTRRAVARAVAAGAGRGSASVRWVRAVRSITGGLTGPVARSAMRKFLHCPIMPRFWSRAKESARPSIASSLGYSARLTRPKWALRSGAATASERQSMLSCRARGDARR